MAIWYKVQKAWPVPAVKGTLWENLACKPSWTRVSEMKEDPHKQVADKLIWATQFCKLGFAEVPLKFQDFRGGSENLTLSSDEWHRLSCSSPEALGSF